MLTLGCTKTLEEDEWVGDNVIAFHAEWLDSLLPDPQTVKMFAPSVVELLCSLPETSKQDASQIVPVPEQRYLLLPVSDRYSESGAAHNSDGSHWSLVLLDTETAVGYHFDSLGGINRLAADRVYGVVLHLVGQKPASRSALLVEGLQGQTNGSDCGIYVLLLSSLLHRALASNAQLDHVIQGLCNYATPDRTKAFRRKYLDWLVLWGRRSHHEEHVEATRAVRSDFLDLFPDLGSARS